MSLESLCNQDVITVQTETATTGASFGNTVSLGAASVIRCLVQEMGASEILKYQAQGVEVSHELFFSTDPSITKQQRITWNGTKLEVKAYYKEGRPGKNLLWIVIANAITTRDR